MPSESSTLRLHLSSAHSLAVLLWSAVRVLVLVGLLLGVPHLLLVSLPLMLLGLFQVLGYHFSHIQHSQGALLTLDSERQRLEYIKGETYHRWAFAEVYRVEEIRPNGRWYRWLGRAVRWLPLAAYKLYRLQHHDGTVIILSALMLRGQAWPETLQPAGRFGPTLPNDPRLQWQQAVGLSAEQLAAPRPLDPKLRRIFHSVGRHKGAYLRRHGKLPHYSE